MTFQDFLANHGYEVTALIEDGRIHRFRGPDEKPGKKSAWYVYFGTAGVVGDWRTGKKLNWFDRDKIREDFAAADKGLKNRLHELTIRRYQEQERNRVSAKRRAQVMWARSNEILYGEGHPYLARKGVQPHKTRRYKGLMLVPLYHVSDLSGITNVQCVHTDGTKRFLRDGLVEGGFYRIGFPVNPRQRVYVCEGFATAATVNELTGHPSVVAFNCGNLMAVASSHRQYRPVIVSDNDHRTVIRGRFANPGLESATAAARSLRLEFVVPIWDDPAVTDFNDLRRIAGDKEARRQLGMRMTA